MRYLLDTHVAVWAVMDDERLPRTAWDLIADRSNDIYVSAVSLWEISIKYALARQSDPMPFSATEGARQFEAAGFLILNVDRHHAIALDTLPPLHPDPFDRLLVAQAMAETIRFMTRDRRLSIYSELVTLV